MNKLTLSFIKDEIKNRKHHLKYDERNLGERISGFYSDRIAPPVTSNSRITAVQEENSVYPFAQKVLCFAARLYHELSSLFLQVYILFARYLFQRRLTKFPVNFMDTYSTRIGSLPLESSGLRFNSSNRYYSNLRFQVVGPDSLRLSSLSR